jgi:hypothetical protein
VIDPEPAPLASQYRFAPARLTQKGALRVYEDHSPGAQAVTITFQYNPEAVRRTLAMRTPPAEGAKARGAPQDVFRASGPPVENITLSVELDAADQPSQQSNQGKGLLPVLAQLELLLYPSSARIRDAENAASQGSAHANPTQVPLIVLVLGANRVLPVLLTNFSIAEEHFDTFYNPIQAKVEFGFRVLTTMEMGDQSAGTDAYRAYHSSKEQLSQQGAQAGVPASGGST